ncbi:M20 family metallopeptidase [Veronia pacifica]|uniref:Peptidase M20 n=1 Tax=Veronia pacifica TaxID=1080227 RepID=A0A1C3EKY3_9GAMM|nr:M20 family metallopeptidase [Veronia pacifica]ODA33892.1 peptidase M20 [Veronia pacifica]
MFDFGCECDFDELREFILCNSYSKNKKGIDQHGEQMISQLLPLNYQVERFSREDIGNHLLFTSNKRDGLKILLLGHLDTVYPPGTFTSFTQDEEWVYGPGVCDMKGGNFVALNALRNLYHELPSGVYNIDFLLVSDEETGSDDSRELTARIATQYDYCLVFEAAGKNHEVVTGRKGIATYQVEITGKAAHAGNHYIDGIDANLALSQLLIKLKALTRLDKGTTVNPGKIQGGLGANTISPTAQMLVEARFSDQEEKHRVMSSIHNLCGLIEKSGVSVSLSGGLQRDVMEPNVRQQALITALNQILPTDIVTEQRGGVSDANIVAGAGTVTLDGWGPFGDGDHTVHERASKQSFLRRIREVTDILRFLISDSAQQSLKPE